MKKTILSIIIAAVFAFTLAACSTENTQETWRLGDYKGEYVGFRLEDEETEHPKVIIRFEFTNYSTEPISFEKALTPRLYQNEAELIRADDMVDAAAIDVAPGDSHSIDLTYYLMNMTDLVEIKITNSVTGESHSVRTHTEK